MKILLKALGIFEKEYDYPGQETEYIYFIHRISPMFSYITGVEDISPTAGKKAKFMHTGKFKDKMPIYEFIDLE